MIRGMIIEGGVVVNIALFTSEAELFDGWQLCPDGVGIGYTDNGDGTFTAPPSVTLPE